jgi:hypothetical protein
VLRELHRRERLLSKTYNPNNTEFDENEEEYIFNSLLGDKNNDNNFGHQIKSADNEHRLDRIIHNSSKVIRELVFYLLYFYLLLLIYFYNYYRSTFKLLFFIKISRF